MTPNAPLDLTAVHAPNEGQPNRIDLAWSPVEGALYNVYRNMVAINVQVGDTELYDFAPEYHKHYVYTVTAVIDGIESDHSEGAVAFATEYRLPFATVAQLEAFWRVLTASEQTRATALLQLASDRLRTLAGDAGANLDTRSMTDPAFKAVVNWVVMEAVKRAMISPSDQPSVESAQITAGPYSENYKYTNPTGDMFFRKSELAAIGIGGKQSLNSISLKTTREIYPTDEG